MSESTSISVFAVCEAGQKCDALADAAVRLQAPDLAEILVANKSLADAWARGRFLRQLRELSEGPICQEIAAQRMGFVTEEAFRTMLASDPESRDVWQQGRHRFFLAARVLLMRSAEAGRPHAIKALERLLQAEGGNQHAATPMDFRHLTPTQMERATTIHRQQLTRWKRQGLVMNGDGTYSLPQFVAWLRKNPRVGKSRQYVRKPGAIEKRILQRVGTILQEELGSAGEACREKQPTLSRKGE